MVLQAGFRSQQIWCLVNHFLVPKWPSLLCPSGEDLVEGAGQLWGCFYNPTSQSPTS
jgi:hypothetical protein